MIDIETNICANVVTEMERLGFQQASVNAVKAQPQFSEAYDKQNQLQKTMLTMLFYNILINGTHIAPSQIRLALNVATDIVGWWDDMRLVILPFLKENEAMFFVS
jgi:hypothetical protein